MIQINIFIGNKGNVITSIANEGTVDGAQTFKNSVNILARANLQWTLDVTWLVDKRESTDVVLISQRRASSYCMFVALLVLTGMFAFMHVVRKTLYILVSIFWKDAKIFVRCTLHYSLVWKRRQWQRPCRLYGYLLSILERNLHASLKINTKGKGSKSK